VVILLGKNGKTADKVVQNTVDVLCYVAMGILLVLMFLGTGDVIGRYTLNTPIKGTLEISRFLVAGIVFFGWGYVQITRGHISVDIVISHWSKKAQARLALAMHFIMLFVFSLIAWQGTVTALDSLRSGRIIMTIDIPLYPFQFFVPLGGLISCAVLVSQIVHMIHAMKRGT